MTPLLILLRSQPATVQARLAVVVLLMFVAAAMEMVGIGALVPVIQIMQGGDAGSSGVGGRVFAHLSASGLTRFQFSTVLLALLGFYLVKNTFQTLLDVFEFRTLARVQSRLSTQLMRLYLRRPYAFHLGVNTSQLIRNVTTEIDTIFYYSMVPFGVLLAECMVVTALFLLVLLLDPKGALALIGCGLFLLLVYVLALRDRMSAIGAGLQVASGKMIQYAQEGLGAVKELKVMGREGYFENAFSEQVQNYSRALRRALVIHNFPAHMLEAFFVAVFVGMALWLEADGGGKQSFPMLAVYAAAAFRLIPSLNRIMSALTRLRQGRASLDVVMSDLAAPGLAPVCDQTGKPVFSREIRVSDLTYSYPEADKSALQGIHLSIARGEMVAFVGRSGSGKTTIVDCMLGLLQPSSGRIEVDGIDIMVDPKAWQRQIGYIPQHIYLTDDTLLRNVALGVPDVEIDVEKAWRALESAQLAEFVRGLPGQLELRVGERGVRLSGGQRQRIGIARAIYHDPAVIVLDEATSALDAETEKAIVDTISQLKGSRTIIVIAHRLSTIEECDRVFVIEDGKLSSERPGSSAKSPADARLA